MFYSIPILFVYCCALHQVDKFVFFLQLWNKNLRGKDNKPRGSNTGMLWGWKCGWPHEHVCLIMHAGSKPFFDCHRKFQDVFLCGFEQPLVVDAAWLSHKHCAVDWLRVATLTFSRGLLTVCRQGSNTLQRRRYTLLLISAWVAVGGGEVWGFIYCTQLEPTTMRT